MARPPRPGSRGRAGNVEGGGSIARSPPPFPTKPQQKQVPSVPSVPSGSSNPLLEAGRCTLTSSLKARSASPCVSSRPQLLPQLDSQISLPQPSRRVLATGLAPALPEPKALSRRALSAGPSVLPPILEGGREAHIMETRCVPFPVVSNVATFERPRSYADALKNNNALQRELPVPAPPLRPRRGLCAPIDDAVRRDFLGDGIALDQAVASRRGAGWSVKQRQVQRSDLGHCCHGCRQPLRDLSEEVTVWTGAAIYRRFHPSCAASFMLRCDTEGGASGSTSDPSTVAACSVASGDVVEGYADGWRAPRDGNAPRLPREPRPSVGEAMTTITVTTESGEKKVVPGLSHEQLRTLQVRHRWRPSASEGEGDGCGVECAVCFGELDADALCVQLPCAPQHVFHWACVLPWLRKASLCPTCRKDLRPLLPPSRGVSR